VYIVKQWRKEKMIKPPTEEFAYATFTQIPHLKYSGDHKF